MSSSGKTRRFHERLPQIRSAAAGIDVGGSEIWVDVTSRDPEPVRKFATFRADLHELADWLNHCGIDTVAMESTGVYWIPVCQILESKGIEVVLVNARHAKLSLGSPYARITKLAAGSCSVAALSSPPTALGLS